MRHRFRTFILLALFGATCLPAEADERVIGAFSDKDISEWEPHTFSNRTRYRFVDLNGRVALEARCDNAASGLIRRESIDLSETPLLHWSWRVDDTFNGTEETTRAGDDFPARVYVISRNRLFPWRSRALSYVWAGTQPVGSDWPNPHLSQTHMIVKRSGPPPRPGTWHSETVDLRDDFQRYHDRTPDTVDAIAIMTDCDNTGGTARAWYGDIILMDEPGNDPD